METPEFIGLKRSDELKDLAGALAKAQGVMEGASKDKVNPHFKNKYADLGSVWDAVREPLSKNGLAVLQLPFTDNQGRVAVSTMLMHSSGQWIEAAYALPPTKADAQGFGSAITYMKRYALTGMGVAPEDDDGNAATGKNGNGHSDALPPLSRPQADDLSAANAQYAKACEDVVKRFVKHSDLQAWEKRNAPGLAKLQAADAALYRGLYATIQDRYAALNPMNAG